MVDSDGNSSRGDANATLCAGNPRPPAGRHLALEARWRSAELSVADQAREAEQMCPWAGASVPAQGLGVCGRRSVAPLGRRGFRSKTRPCRFSARPVPGPVACARRGTPTRTGRNSSLLRTGLHPPDGGVGTRNQSTMTSPATIAAGAGESAMAGPRDVRRWGNSAFEVTLTE